MAMPIFGRNCCLLVLLAASALAEDALTTAPVIQGSPAAISIDAAGNRYVAGTFGGSVDFNPGVGEDSRTSTSFKDLFVTRFNADGSYGWTQALGNIGYNNAAAVVVSNNVIYVGGWLENFDFGIIQPEPPVPLLNTAVLEPAPPIRINPPPATPPSPLFASLPSNVSIAYVLALDATSGAPLTTFGNGGIGPIPPAAARRQKRWRSQEIFCTWAARRISRRSLLALEALSPTINGCRSWLLLLPIAAHS